MYIYIICIYIYNMYIYIYILYIFPKKTAPHPSSCVPGDVQGLFQKILASTRNWLVVD